jgi:hypothetical protein
VLIICNYVSLFYKRVNIKVIDIYKANVWNTSLHHQPLLAGYTLGLGSKFLYFLPLVLYGCETWSLTLREEHRLRVFKNRVLRKIFRPKRDKVLGDWRKLHNEELRNLHCLPSIIGIIKSRRMR